MSSVLANLLYSKEHEWIQVLDEKTVRLGITDFAQHELGDIVFVELPEIDATVEVNSSIGTVESVKAVSDIFTPISGVITKINEILVESPELVNTEPYENGWMVEMEIADASVLSSLLTPEQYEKLTAEG